MLVSYYTGWHVQETWRKNACTCKTSFSRLHFWFILISFHKFFPKFELPNSRCGLSASAAYTPVFTVICETQFPPIKTMSLLISDLLIHKLPKHIISIVNGLSPGRVSADHLMGLSEWEQFCKNFGECRKLIGLELNCSQYRIFPWDVNRSARRAAILGQVVQSPIKLTQG